MSGATFDLDLKYIFSVSPLIYLPSPPYLIFHSLSRTRDSSGGLGGEGGSVGARGRRRRGRFQGSFFFNAMECFVVDETSSSTDRLTAHTLPTCYRPPPVLRTRAAHQQRAPRTPRRRGESAGLNERLGRLARAARRRAARPGGLGVVLRRRGQGGRGPCGCAVPRSRSSRKSKKIF